MDEMIELVDEGFFFRCIYGSFTFEYVESVAPDTVKQEISEDISYPSEYEHDIYIKNPE